MAALMARHKLEQMGRPAVVISQGTLNIRHKPATRNAIAALAEIDIDGNTHRSQGIDLNLLRHADWIVVMAPRHARVLIQRAPDLRGRIVRLWRWADDDRDLDAIADPVGEDLETFRACRDLIEQCLDNWLDTV